MNQISEVTPYKIIVFGIKYNKEFTNLEN